MNDTPLYVYIVVRDTSDEEVARIECLTEEQANRMLGDIELIAGEYAKIETSATPIERT